MFEVTQETPNSSKILSEGALNFLSKFISAFEDRRRQLLEERENTQKSIDSGNFMGFPADTSIRDKARHISKLGCSLFTLISNMGTPVKY